MKKLLYILLFVFSFANGFSQKDTSKVFVEAEEMPTYPGGMQGLMDYLKININYPKISKEKGHMGRPLFKFIIDTLGLVGSVEVCISSGHPELDAEGMRVIFGMAKWNPGKQNGKKVPVYFNLPINFVLNSPSAEYQNKWRNTYIDYYFNNGVKAVNENKLNDALGYFENALMLNKNDIDVLYNKGVVLIKQKNYTDACGTFQKIKELGRSDADELIRKHCANIELPPLSAADTTQVYTVVEKMPTYPGGVNKVYEFVEQNFNKDLKKKETTYTNSKVFINFVIATNGNVKDLKILRSSGNEVLDKEAMRVVGLIKGWIPGEQNGTKVQVTYNLSVSII